MTGPEYRYLTYETLEPMGTPQDPGMPDWRTAPPAVAAARDLVAAPGPVG
jgi:hypothetical protein